MTFFAPYKDGWILRIKLAPNSSCNGFKEVVTGADGEKYLKAAVTVAPEKGKANKELINMLSKHLKISKQNISVVFGQTDHYKKIYIETEDITDFAERLQGLEKGQNNR